MISVLQSADQKECRSETPCSDANFKSVFGGNFMVQIGAFSRCKLLHTVIELQRVNDLSVICNMYALDDKSSGLKKYLQDVAFTSNTV